MFSLSFSLFLRLMVSGSAALPEPVMKAWQDITGEISTIHVQYNCIMRFRLLCIGVMRCPLMYYISYYLVEVVVRVMVVPREIYHAGLKVKKIWRSHFSD